MYCFVYVSSCAVPSADSWVEMMEKARNEGLLLVNKYEQKLSENNLNGSVHFEIGKPGEVVISEEI